MNSEVSRYLDNLEGMFGQKEVLDIIEQRMDGNNEEKNQEAALQIIDRNIQLTNDQKQIFDALQVNLKNIQGDIATEMILSRIDKCAQFLDLEAPSPLTKRIVLHKMKQKYRFSKERRTQFEIPAIKDIADLHQLEFTDKDKENWHYWQKHRNFLELKYVKGANPKPGLEMINRIDRQSDKILQFFRDPRNPYSDENESKGKDFTTSGLVIGNVQSGKTANFMSIISKSVSIGYRFIIILSGTKNDLRNQTQNRYDQELSGIDRYNLRGRGTKFVDWQSTDASEVLMEWSIDGVQTPSPANSGNFWRYHSLTTTEDLSEQLPNMTDVFEQHNVVVAVIKKNALKPAPDAEDYEYKGILGRLNRWVLNRRDQTFLPPTLIIDDEADQASVDSNASPETLEEEGYSPTTINGCLQTLVRDIYGKKLSAAAKARQITFVGYTATPFANVFMSSVHDSLYPKDFIISLNPPENYFGMEKYFGEKLSDIYINRCNEQIAMDERELLINPMMVHPVPPEETLPGRLISAFHQFLFYSVIKDYRKLKQEKTMMVHSSRLVDEQAIIFNKIKCYKEVLEQDLTTSGTRGVYYTKIKSEWENFVEGSNKIQELLEKQYAMPEFSENDLLEKLTGILASLKMKLINGKNDSLDYAQEQLDYVVAVGGDILSRGLTLEGLAISYYMRNSYNYDSLLQMARWFGYRDKYEDLIRVYTSEDISDSFEHLLRVEADLREEIKNYERNGVTPSEFAPRVRAHSRMRPSGRMGVAQRQSSFSGQLIQTFLMNVSVDVIQKNYELTHKFIEQIHKNYNPQIGEGKIEFKGVEPESVLTHFIDSYLFAFTDTRGIKREEIQNYIKGRMNSGELNKMDVVISGLKNIKENSEQINLLDGEIKINPVVRNNTRGEIIDNILHFGAISSPSDFKDNDKNTKLVIYFIDRKNSSEAFKNEPEVNPVVFAINFPEFGDAEYWRQEIFNN